jgi:ABC-type multidrug transport system fused ATPase/permease subunit
MLIHPDLLAALLPAVVGAVTGIAIGRRVAARAAVRAAEAEAALAARWREHAAAAGRWLPASAGQWLAEELTARAVAAGRSATARAIAGGWWQPAAAAAIAIGVALVLVPGSRHVASGSISAGQLAAGIFLVLLAIGPLLELASAADRWLVLGAAARRLAMPIRDRQVPVASPALQWEAMRLVLPSGRTLLLPAGSVAPGGRLLLHGPSGSGKSTLLGMLAGERPAAAACAAPPAGPGGTVLLGQGGHLPPWKVGELLAAVEPDRARIDAMAVELGLDSLLPADAAPCQWLDDVQSQAVGLLAAALVRPCALLVDEAVSALPSVVVERALERIASSGVAVVCAAHRQEAMAAWPRLALG